MLKYQFDSREILDAWKEKHTTKNIIDEVIYRRTDIQPHFWIHAQDFKEPVDFPCVMIVARLYDGWWENDFVYPSDFAQ